MFLLREGILDDKGINQLEKEVEAELQAAVDLALDALPPVPESITKYVYSPDVDPTSPAFDTSRRCQKARLRLTARRRRPRPWPI